MHLTTLLDLLRADPLGPDREERGLVLAALGAMLDPELLAAPRAFALKGAAEAWRAEDDKRRAAWAEQTLWHQAVPNQYTRLDWVEVELLARNVEPTDPVPWSVRFHVGTGGRPRPERTILAPTAADACNLVDQRWPMASWVHDLIEKPSALKRALIDGLKPR